jgi:arginyl-tRNA synthetase
VVDEVGRDAVRFMMLYRNNDATLDFDLAKVIKQQRDNPVFYVQYGHTRAQSVFRNAYKTFPGLLPEEPRARKAILSSVTLDPLQEKAELTVIRRLALYPRVIESAALAHEPHRIAFYLFDLASEFHSLYDTPHYRFISENNDSTTTMARLALVEGVVTVIASGLGLLGVNAPDEMR